MRRVTSLLIAMLLFASGAWAQGTVTLGTGTDSNSTTVHPTPYGTYYKNHRVQYLILASELSGLGIVAGDITALGFDVANVNNCSAMPNFTIELKQTAAEELTTTFDNDGFTTVWTDPNFLPVVGWNTHTFISPFVWDGTSNILVDICFDIIPGNYTQNASVFYTETTTSLASYYRSDTQAACGTTNAATLSPNRANMQITGELADCVPPTDLTASNITMTTADLSWTPVGTETLWNVEVGLAGFEPGTGAEVAGITGTSITSWTVTGLDPVIIYDFYVQADCGTDAVSTWAGPATFQTTSAPLSGNYTIDSGNPTGGTNFNSFTDFADAMNLGGFGGPVVVDVVTGSGPYNEQIMLGELPNSSDVNTLTINGNGETLEFLATVSTERYTLAFNGTDYVTVDNLTVVALGAGGTAEYGWAVWLTNNADYNTFTNCTFVANTTETQTNYAAFVTSNSATGPTSTGLAASNLTVQYCTTVGGYYGMIINGPSSAPYAENSLITNNEITDFRLYGLYVRGQNNSVFSENNIYRPNRPEVSTTYGIYLTQDLSGSEVTKNQVFQFAGNTTSTSGAYAIYGTTLTAEVGQELLIANNLVYGFDGMNGLQRGMALFTTNNVKVYHNTISVDATGHTGSSAIQGIYHSGNLNTIDIQNNIVSVTSNSTGTKHCLYFAQSAGNEPVLTSDNNVLFMGATGGTNYMTRWSGNDYATLADWQVEGYDGASVDADPGFAAPLLTPISPLANDIGADLLAFVPDDYFGVARTATPDPGAIEFDPPDCFPPTNLTAANITSTSADLGWTPGADETMWNIEWGMAGFTQGTGTLIEGVTVNPYTLDGLVAATSYAFYVQADCNTEALSPWAGPFTFTTECDVFVTYPYYQGFEAEFPPVCWTYVNGEPGSYWERTSVSVNTGSFAARSYQGVSSSYVADEWLIMPAFDLDAGSSVWLKFYGYSSQAPGGGKENMRIMALDQVYDNVEDLHLNAVEVAVVPFTQTWEEYLVNISAFEGVKYFAFNYFIPENVGFNWIYIDDVEMLELEVGTISGFVTEATRSPIEGAHVYAGEYSAFTDVNGFYELTDVLPGTYNVTCEADGYLSQVAEDVLLPAGGAVTLDFALEYASIAVTPESLEATLEFGETETQTLTISNPSGTGALSWSAGIAFLSDRSGNIFSYPADQGKNRSMGNAERNPAPSAYPLEPGRELFDLLGHFPPGVGGGEYSVATDGQNIYTAAWNSATFYRYAMDGTYIESFTIAGAGNVRDLAFDGQYFYASPNSTTIYVMDFTAETLISTISAPNAVRGLAYDADEDAFWVTNGWNGPLSQISRAGAVLQTLATTVTSMSGLAWENVSDGGPYLWAYTQPAAPSDNVLAQIDLTTGAPLQTFDLATLGIFAVDAISGGLTITNQLVPGMWTFLGTSQNDVIWILELAPDANWLSLSPTFGTVEPGETFNVEVTFDAGQVFEIGTYLADIIITHNGQPVESEIIVPATLNMTAIPWGTVEGYVTEATRGPIEGAHVYAGDYEAFTDVNGFYQIENVLPGTYDFTCEAEDYFPVVVEDFEVLASAVNELDFQLGFASIAVNPDFIEEMLEPNETSMQLLTISNPTGTEPLVWNAQVILEEERSTPPFMVYDEPVTFAPDAYIKGTNPDPTDDGIECPEDAIFSQPAVNFATAYTADEDVNYSVYQSFSLRGDLGGLRFWTISAFFDGVGWGACEGIDPRPFTIAFYEDNAGQPGTMVAEFVLELNRVNTGLFFATTWPIYEYTAEFPSTVTMSAGWFSVQSMVGTAVNCWNLVLNEPGGLGQCLQYDGAVFTPQDEPLGFCLMGTPEVPWLSISPNSGTILPGESFDVEVYFDATGLVDTTYYGDININHNALPVADGMLTVPVELTVASITPPVAATLISPESGATFVPLQPEFFWENGARTAQTRLVITQGTPPFTTTVYTSPWLLEGEYFNLAETTFELNPKQNYGWRVLARNAAGTVPSVLNSFQTIGAGTIAGQVTNAFSGDGMEGVTITAEELRYAAVTDVNGDYTITDVVEGMYTVTASKEGFTPETQVVEVIHGANVIANFELNIILEPVLNFQAEIQNVFDVLLTWSAPMIFNERSVNLEPKASRRPAMVYGQDAYEQAEFTGEFKPTPTSATMPVNRDALYSNVELVNSECATTQDPESMIISPSTLFGSSFNHAGGFTVADDFTVPAGATWNVETMEFFGYQTNSTTTSSFTGVYVQIWDGDPMNGGEVIWGDLITNVMASTDFTGIYRVSSTASCNTQRPIMSIIATTTDLILPPGTYYVEWGATGSLASGPWIPTVSVGAAGNSMQYTPDGWTLIESPDLSGNYHELPFVINGTFSGGMIPENLLGFNLYRDDVLLDYVPLERSYEYLDEGLAAGTYAYTVKAVYIEGESPEAGPEIVSILAPPTLLVAEQVGPEVYLEWESNFVGKGLADNQTVQHFYSTFNFMKVMKKGTDNQAPYKAPDQVRQGGNTIAEAFEITAIPFMVTGTTTGYTNDYDEVCPFEGSTAPDVVYKFTPTSNMVANIDLCGSSYDTKLYVYENAHTPGDPFACNDDFYGSGDPCGSWVSALFNLPLTGGNTYYIVVDGYGTANGDYIIEITEAELCQVDCPPGALLEGELCGEDLNGGCNSDVPVFESIAIGDVICGTSWADDGNRDTDWFELVIDAPKTLTWSVTAEFPLLIFIIDGNAGCDGLTILGDAVADPCETAVVSATVQPGTYWVWVGPSLFEGYPCGSQNNYVAELTAEDAYIPFFTVYRDGVALEDVYGTTYMDAGIEQGETYCYTVTESPQFELETGFSNEICVDIPLYGEIAVNPVALFEIHDPAPAVTTQTITVTNNGAGVMEFDIDVELPDDGAETSGLCLNPVTFTNGCSFGDGIESWSLANVNVPVIPCSGTPAWYKDYTDMVHELEAGETYVLTLTSGYSGQFFTIWIDFNNDLELTPDEIVLQGEITASGTPTTFDFTVPEDAPGGVFTGRCLTKWLSPFPEDPCGTYSYGNVVDFMFSIGGGWLTVEPEMGVLNPGESMNIDVVFNSAGLDYGLHNANINFLTNNPFAEQPEVVVPVELEIPYPVQDILLPMGWSGWSAYIDPMMDAMFEDVVAPVVGDMIITQYFTNVFYPAYGINTMGEFSHNHGYVTKMDAEAVLSLEGMPVEPVVSLTAGWNLFPVLVPCNLDAADVFGGITGFVIAYEVAGSAMYYPAGEVYTLTELVPGKAYWVKVTADTDYTFPGCDPEGKSSYIAPLRHGNTTSWDDVTYTGLSHVVVFDKNASAMLIPGDVIGAFTSDGTIAGMTIVSENNASLAVFGEDITTAANDGFVDGEPLSYKLYRHANQTEYILDVNYSTKAPNYDGKFANHGMSIVDDMSMTATGISSPELSGLSIYPNPSDGLFNVSVDDLTKEVNYVIMDAKGQMVTEGKLAASQVIDLSDQPRGVYFIKFVGNDILRIEKLVLR